MDKELRKDIRKAEQEVRKHVSSRRLAKRNGTHRTLPNLCGPALCVLLLKELGLTATQTQILGASGRRKQYWKDGVSDYYLAVAVARLFPKKKAVVYSGEFLTVYDLERICKKTKKLVGVDWQRYKPKKGHTDPGDGGHWDAVKMVIAPKGYKKRKWPLKKGLLVLTEVSKGAKKRSREVNTEKFRRGWWDTDVDARGAQYGRISLAIVIASSREQARMRNLGLKPVLP